jgi:serine O-acetyltransferase
MVMSPEKTQLLHAFAEELRKNREHRSLGIQLKREAQKFVDSLLSTLFPQFSKEKFTSLEEVKSKLFVLERDIQSLLTPLLADTALHAEDVAARFFQELPEVHRKLWLDAEAIYGGDPAAESIDEVILAYPGFFAIAIYRFAHEFYKLRVPVFPRLLTEYAHEKTAIDIHPGATIGESFAIDHGTGIVIGESVIIGTNVKIYQGVTLGALSVDKKMAKLKRHPTIEDNVVVYAHAVILGGDTVVGHHSIVGGNVWMTESVPSYSIVYHERDVIVQNQLDKKGVINWVI